MAIRPVVTCRNVSVTGVRSASLTKLEFFFGVGEEPFGVDRYPQGEDLVPKGRTIQFSNVFPSLFANCSISISEQR